MKGQLTFSSPAKLEKAHQLKLVTPQVGIDFPYMYK
jgi:hypothetical protein